MPTNPRRNTPNEMFGNYRAEINRKCVSTLRAAILNEDGIYASGGSEQGSLDGVGNGDEHEPVFGIEVILAAFVNDPDVAVLFGLRIREHAIDFVAFQRGRIALVFKADNKSGFGFL